MKTIGVLALLAISAFPTLEAAEQTGLRRMKRSTGANQSSPVKGGRSRNLFVTNANAAMPFIFNGEGLWSRMRLVNLETRSVDFEVFFVNDNGSDASVDIKDIGVVASVKGTVQALGTATIDTSGAGNDQIAWAFVDAGGALLTSTVSVEYLDGGFTYGASYAATNVLERKTIVPFDTTDGNDVEVSVVNLNSNAMDINIIIRDGAGQQLASQTKTLDALGAFGFVPTDAVETAKNIRGTVEFSIDPNATGGLGVVNTQYFAKGGFNLFTGFSQVP